MGLAASQARLLMLTARIHDVEYQAQAIQNAKLQLATQEDEVYRKYTEALDATTFIFRDDQGTMVPANFNNLCGLASVTNGLNKSYVFRTGDDDRLIVPATIYDGYKKFGGTDPYAFAMFMLGVNQEATNEAEQQYMQNRLSSDADSTLTDLQEALNNMIKSIAKACGYSDTAAEAAVDDINGGGSIEALLPAKDAENYDKVKALIDEYKAKKDEFRYKLYQRGGAENIYELATNDSKDNFDQEKFNYFLKWGKLISQEVGLEYCICENDYSENFGNDAETLNQLLQAGRITVDEISLDKKGKLTDAATSVASDNSLDYVNTSTIDKRELAKAEAEYEHDMKKIDKKDKQYDMELSKLETERNALTTEYDSVKKVIKDNIERTFGIFS